MVKEPNKPSQAQEPKSRPDDSDKFTTEPIREEVGTADFTPLATDERSIRGAQEYLDIAYHFMQIDFTNRLIRPIPGVFIATTTKKFLKLAREFKPSGVLVADATPVAVAGTTTGTLASYTIPLNTISRNDEVRDPAGNVFRVTAWGRYTTDDDTATVTINLRVGGTTYHSIVSTGLTATNAFWRIDWNIIIKTIGTSGTAESYASAKINNVNKDNGSTSSKAIDTTLDQDIDITTSWTSGDAGDGISLRGWMVELLN